MATEYLMELAKEIESRAAEAEYRALVRMSMRGSHAVDREEVEARYHNRAQPLFEPFTRIPDPSSYERVRDSLHSAMGYLAHDSDRRGGDRDPVSGETISANRDLAAIDSAGEQLVGWTGFAAQRFKENFLDPFPYVASNQFLVLGIMKGAVEADQEVWKRTQKDIDDIAHRTLETLDTLDDWSEGEIEFTISVVGAIAAIGAIPFTGGASTAVAVIGAAASTADAVHKAEESIKQDYGSASQVLQAMEVAIQTLTGHVREQQARIVSTLTSCAKEVNRHRNTTSPFVSARPKLAAIEGTDLISDDGVGWPR